MNLMENEMAYLQEKRWDYVDAQDVIEVCDELLDQLTDSNPLGAEQEQRHEGFVEAIQDVKHAAVQNGKGGVDLHYIGWNGFIPVKANDYGYVNGLEAVQDALGALIRERGL
jgi:hypothetical protein